MGKAQTEAAMREAAEMHERRRLKLYSGAALMRLDTAGGTNWQLFNATYPAYSEAEATGLMMEEIQQRCPNHVVCSHTMAKINDGVIKQVAGG